MKDSLNHHLHERFLGHEAPVDPGLWQVIEARLIAAGPATDPVNDLFRERFQEHEAEIDASVWDGINSQLNPTASLTSGLAQTWGWWAAAIGIVAVSTMSVLLWPEAAENARQPQQGILAPPESGLPDQDAAVSSSTAQEAAPVSALSQLPTLPRNMEARPMADEAEVALDPVSQPADEQGHAADAAVVVDQILEQITVQTMLQALAPEPEQQPAAASTKPTGGTPSTNPADPEVVAAPRAEAVLFMPNAFTPNGDGVNDTYQIVPESGASLSSAMVRVYSMKSNQLVFSSSNLSDPWTGAGCEDGMYLVAVEAITLEGSVVSEGRVVWLNRTSMN
jgi:hypothetical protein